MVDLALNSIDENFLKTVTLGAMVYGQKLLGTDDRKRYQKERSTVKLK